MSDRERWIVYPLLFLAIGLALRNDVEMQDEGHGADVELVRCKALEVMGSEGKPTVRIATSSNGDGFLETGNASGGIQSRLGANPSGAALELLDCEGKIYALVGHEGERVGLFAGNTESGRVLSLISVISHPPAGEQNSAAPEKTPEGERNSVTPGKAPAAPATPDESKETSTPPAQK